MKPLSDLNSYFGVTVDKVSFAGYLMHQTYKVMGLISIGKDMYMSNENYVYVRIGRKTDFIAENIISLFFAGSYYIAVDDRLNYYITTVIYDNSLKPKITIHEKTTLDLNLGFLRPSCCSVILSNLKYKYTYVNLSGAYIVVDNISSPSVTTAGIMDLDMDYARNNNGSRFFYALYGSDSYEYAALLERETKIIDEENSYLDRLYNSKRQVTSLQEYNSQWNGAMTGIEKTLVKKTVYDYVWDNTSLPYAHIAENAIGLLQSVTEEVSDISGLKISANQLFSAYEVVTDSDNIERLTYRSLLAENGLNTSDRIIMNEVIQYTAAGQIGLLGSIVKEESNPRLYSQAIYSDLVPDLLIASFDGVNYDGSKNCMSGYAGFENYETMTFVNMSIHTPYFILSGAQPSHHSLIGTTSAYFKDDGRIILKDKIYLDSSCSSKYILNLIMKSASSSQWELVTEFIDPASVTKITRNIPAGTYVDMVLFKSADCESKVYLYNPESYRMNGYVDSNGIPTFLMIDPGNQKTFGSFALEVREEGGKKYFGENLVLNQLNVYGYARLGGFNNVEKKKLVFDRHNTITQFRFRNNAQLIESNKDYDVSYDSFLLSGQGNVGAMLKGAKSVLTVIVSQKRVLLYIDETYLLKPIEFDTSISDDFIWFICMKRDILFFIIDGKLVYSMTLPANFMINTVNILNSTSFFDKLGKILFVQNYDVLVNYYDTFGRLLQSQALRIMYDSIDRLVIDTYFYNRNDQIVAKCLKGAYPIDRQTKITTNDYPLQYRENYASIDWSTAAEADPRGVLSGELASYYNTGEGKNVTAAENDYKYPYYYYEYETGGYLRPILEMQPGANGFLNKEQYTYHDDNTFDSYAKDFKPLDTDYGSVRSISNDDAATELTKCRLFDTENILGESLNSTTQTGENLTYKINYSLISNQLSGAAYPAIGTTYYQAVHPLEKAMSRYSMAYNRISIDWGADRGYRILVSDSAGNGRFILQDFSISAKLVNYFKYDKRNRLIESGYVEISDSVTWDNLLAFANNMEYPRNDSAGITVHQMLVTYEYDMEGYGYSLGRLCRTITYSAYSCIEYFYDQLGRLSKQTLQDGSVITQEFVRDNLYNLLRIKYVRANMSDYFLDYKYVDNEVKQIDMNQGSAKKTIFSLGEYDIYKRLTNYTDCNGYSISYRYDLFGRQIELGGQKAATSVSVAKKYTESSLADQRLEELKYEPEKITKVFHYDEFMRLKSVSGSETDMNYDKNGNLTSFAKGSTQMTLQYEGVNKLKNASGTIFDYDGAGNVVKVSHGTDYIYQFAPDRMYPSKIAALMITSGGYPVGSRSIYYDGFGRVVHLVQGIANSPVFVYAHSYFDDGRILQIEVTSGSTKTYESYVYVGNRLIAQQNGDNTWNGLCYDDNKTLYIVTSASNIESVKYNAWGLPAQASGATFVYKDMQLLTDINLYFYEGCFYDPSFGVTYSPILGSGAFTPYRIKDDRPFA